MMVNVLKIVVKIIHIIFMLLKMVQTKDIKYAKTVTYVM